MRTHGWGGSPPATDAEAVDRILDAAQEGLDRMGASLGIADVARALGVTRPTVYRYFASTEELLAATAWRATGPFLERMQERLQGVKDPGDAVVTAMLLVTLEVPRSPYLTVALLPDGPHTRLSELTSPEAMELALGLLRGMDVDWDAAGFDDALLRELVEHLLRLLLSFVVDGESAQRSPEDLQGYLDRWLRPAIDRLAARP